VALDLPGEARSELVAWRERAFAGRDDLRLVDPQALHVTLAFLGYRPEKEIELIGRLVDEAAAGVAAPILRASGVVGVPPRRARLLALDLADHDGAAGRLQASVSDGLEAEGIYKPEKRPFWPHVTLARVRRGGAAEPLDAPPPPERDWRAEAVTLYRSTLRPQGALYEPLERVPLAP
jgi:2'-5' RNA ligase